MKRLLAGAAIIVALFSCTTLQPVYAATLPTNVTVKLSYKVNKSHWDSSEVTLPLETYVKYVLVAEMGNSYPLEALKAQAIAARTRITYEIKTNGIRTIKDNSSIQTMKYSADGNIGRIIEAVNATKGKVLTYNGKVIIAYYSQTNGGRVRSSKDVFGWVYPYYKSKDDPWDTAWREKNPGAVDPKNSHGVGLSQVGANYAARNGKGYATILDFYYPGCSVAKGN